MSDNTTLPGTGDVIGDDDIAGVKYQRVKLIRGPDGANQGDIANADGLPVQFQRPANKVLSQAVVSAASSGDNALIAGTASQTSRIFALYLVFDGNVGVKFRSATTDKTGVMSMKTGGSISLPFRGEPYFVTGVAEAFNMNLSVAVQVSGWIDYEKSA